MNAVRFTCIPMRTKKRGEHRLHRRNPRDDKDTQLSLTDDHHHHSQDDQSQNVVYDCCSKDNSCFSALMLP